MRDLRQRHTWTLAFTPLNAVACAKVKANSPKHGTEKQVDVHGFCVPELSFEFEAYVSDGIVTQTKAVGVVVSVSRKSSAFHARINSTC